MAHDDTVGFRARRAVMPEGTRPAAVAVRNGVIVATEPYDARLPARETVVLSEDETLLPGLVDTHVHVNERGRTEWEGFATATRAASSVATSVTCMRCMRLESSASSASSPPLASMSSPWSTSSSSGWP